VKKKYPVQEILTHAEGVYLLRELDRFHPRVATVAHLMLGLGLRIGEARLAQWGWLDNLEQPSATLTIPAEATKSKTARTLPVPTKLRLYLIDARLKRRYNPAIPWPPSWPLIINRWGAPPSKTYCSRVLRRASAKVLHRNVRSHLLRKTFATRLLKHTNLRVVQLALGHRSITSTELYTHPALEDIRSALEQLDSAQLAEAIQ
jgi:integrase